MKKIGVALLILGLVGVSLLVIVQGVPTAQLILLSILWVIVPLLLACGPESISEITAWKASIKRDVYAAKEFRDDAHQVREELRDVAKLVVEDAYILASSSFLAIGGGGPAKARLEKNLEALSKFVEPTGERKNEWLNELHDLFPERHK